MVVGLAVSDSETLSVRDVETDALLESVCDSVDVCIFVSVAVTVGERYMMVLLCVALASTVAVLDTVQSDVLLLDPRLFDLSSVEVTVSVCVRVRVS